MNTHIYSKREEIANAITHGVGLFLSIAALVILVVVASINGSPWEIVSVSIYGVTMIILYASSTLVHSMPAGKWKDIFEIFDHAAIYLFIAGSYTPLLLLLLRGTFGWTLFGIVWGIAIFGVLFKIFFVKRFVVMSTIFYILMGWIIVLAWKPLMASLATGGVMLLVIGGLLYSIGTIFYVWRSFQFHHAVWHLFVLAGSALHFFLILLYVV